MDHTAFGIFLLSIAVSALLFIAAAVLDNLGYKRWAFIGAVLAMLFAVPVLMRLLIFVWKI